MGFFSNGKSEKFEAKVEVENPRTAVAAIEEKIRKLVIEKVSQGVIVRESTRLANSSVSTSADLADLRIIRDEAGIARSRLGEIEAELAGAREELSTYERIQQRPALQQRLDKAKSLVERRNQIAGKVQESLLAFSDSIHALDFVTGELHQISRDPSARGVGATGSAWHPLNLAARLRAPFALSVRGTNYANLVRQPLLTPTDSQIDFFEVEQRAGASLIAELEREIEQINRLENKTETEVA
jgi:hypothetical protein